jgi:hypothetical protein
MKKAGVKPLIFFALFWSAITLLFDAVMVRDGVARLASLRFQPVPCVILESKVTEHQGDEGTSYQPEIRFSYAVDGHEFESERVYAGNRSSTGSRRACRLVELYSTGSRTNAYFNPNEPGYAVLRRGFRGNELFMALFMTPFNLVMVGLWALVVHARRVARHPPFAGGVKFIEAREGKRVRLRTIPPALAAGAALGGVCFVSTFVVGFTKGEYAPLPFVGSLWAVAIGAAVWACLWRLRREASGREDLILHADGKRLTLPQTCGRKTGVTVECSEIVGLDVHVEFDSYKRPSRFIPALVMRGGQRLDLAKWPDLERADRFNDWLRNELQLAPPKIGAGVAK